MLARLAWKGTFLAIAAALIASCASKPVNDTEPVVLPAAEYLIGPGDQLQIFVWRNPDLSIDVPVRPDGKISTPLVEDIQAVGKTPTQLSRDIETVLSKYVKSPQVNVIVTGFVGVFSEQIKVVGKATEPSALPYRRGMTLLDVMIEVGGLAEGAAGNRAKLLRSYNGQNQEIEVRLNDLLDKGSIKENLKMLPGDVLVIPESRF